MGSTTVIKPSESFATQRQPIVVQAGFLLSPEEITRREKEEGFMQAQDLAQAVLSIAILPLTMNVSTMTLIPTHQPLNERPL